MRRRNFLKNLAVGAPAAAVIGVAVKPVEAEKAYSVRLPSEYNVSVGPLTASEVMRRQDESNRRLEAFIEYQNKAIEQYAEMMSRLIPKLYTNA